MQFRIDDYPLNDIFTDSKTVAFFHQEVLLANQVKVILKRKSRHLLSYFAEY